MAIHRHSSMALDSNTRGGVQHDPRPLNLLPRPLLSPRHPRQLAALTLAELDLVTGRARHRSITSPCPPQLLHRFRLELADGSTRRLAAGSLRGPSKSPSTW